MNAFRYIYLSAQPIGTGEYRHGLFCNTCKNMTTHRGNTAMALKNNQLLINFCVSAGKLLQMLTDARPELRFTILNKKVIPR